MRVLWFSINSSLYGACDGIGQSWIAALETPMRNRADVELGIAFEHSDDVFKDVRGSVTYYPIHAFKTKWQKFCRRYNHTEEELIIPKALKVIEDFRPDVIHVFGSEWCWGLVQEHTDIPVVIHMQGSIPPYNNATLPPGYTSHDYNLVPWWNIKLNFYRHLTLKFEYDRALREERILRKCKYFMGRTCWDYALTRLYSPDSEYFVCWEAIRNVFTKSGVRHDYTKKDKCILMTTLSRSSLKGHDVVLKTAKLLKACTNIDFEWRIAGCDVQTLYERKEKIKAEDVDVKYLGALDAEQLYKELTNATIYVHPAYIDNSPNAVCEAMCMGVPIIATYVGGVPSLITHDETGILVPANDPYQMAYHIENLYRDTVKAEEYGRKAQNVALKRHAPNSILECLIGIYKTIISNKKC